MVNKSIAFFIEDLYSGGAEKITSILANELSKEFTKVVVFSFLNNNSSVLNKSVRFVHLKPKFKNGLFLFLTIFRVLLFNRVDKIISLSMPPLNFYLAIVCFIQRRFLIISERNNPKYFPYRIKHRIQRFVSLFLSTKIVFQNDYALNYFKFFLKKSIIIQNPVYAKLRKINLKKVDNLRFIYFGRLSKEKNLYYLIDSFVKFQKVFTDATLDIFGSGNLFNELKNYTKSFYFIKMKKRIQSISHVLKKYKASILVSNYEGTPNSVLESMATCLNIIISKNILFSLNGEQILTSKNSWIVDNSNKSSLTNVLITLATNIELVNTKINNAFDSLKHFDLHKVISLWKKLINE
jgi:glycosyltransferase involved in cell wall biosynthesis